MRTIVPFNDDWLFFPGDVDARTPDSSFQVVTLPHTNIVLPHHNFDNAEYQFISTYRKRFRLPEARDGRRVYVDFDGAMIACEVFLNGQKIGDHEGGYTPFSFDLTDHLNENGDNLLVVRLDSTERPDIPPYGGVVDYLTFGGIYRDVRLRYVEPVHIDKVFARALDVLTGRPRVEIEVTVNNQGAELYAQELGASIYDADGTLIASGDMWVQVPAHSTEIFVLAGFNLPAVKLWSLDAPALYSAMFWLGGAVQTGEKPLRFGFREAVFRDDGFYLNGEKIKLRGLNRHQTYPYIGAAAPARLQRKDADIIKYELGCNIVRTSHYPQSPHFLDRCDEIGLLVFEEIPGWQHIGDQDWQGISLRDVQAMIERDRNHPSIVLWGVRINESMDNEAFYTATNTLAHKLDPTRQTGGVRYFQSSQFLEDVFTFNDFSNSVQEPEHTPHLVTEFNGHMFPTKSWDQEERQLEHALRHARIQDKAAGMDNVTGAIGWCAFDYNTHREFGSGDRICYHGVSDIFRLPKFAAYFYESQLDPAVRPVLRPATFWTMGDRSEGGVNPLVIFSNCDEVEVFFGDARFGRFQPDRKEFPHLPHPPFQIWGLNLLWGGHKFDDLRVVGYVNGQAVIEQQIEADGVPRALVLEADDAELNADGADMTRLVFKIVDKYGNRLPYTNQVVSFEIEGPAELIGENPFALMGGQAALYVKAGRELGTVTVRATTPRLEAAAVTINVK
ncbi:MAG: beta-galactosidase [Chloroflexota bacterium]|nr:MAG: beta-galactosidase [Chloroflexota bacterium]